MMDLFGGGGEVNNNFYESNTEDVLAQSVLFVLCYYWKMHVTYISARNEVGDCG